MSSANQCFYCEVRWNKKTPFTVKFWIDLQGRHIDLCPLSHKSLFCSYDHPQVKFRSDIWDLAFLKIIFTGLKICVRPSCFHTFIVIAAVITQKSLLVGKHSPSPLSCLHSFSLPLSSPILLPPKKSRPRDTCLPFSVACIQGKGRVAIASRPVKVYYLFFFISLPGNLYLDCYW